MIRPLESERRCEREKAMALQTRSIGRAHSKELGPTSSKALSHIPGDDGWPIVGNTLKVLADPKGFVERMVERHGLVVRGHTFGQANVSLLGPDANELVLLDSQKLFSSGLGLVSAQILLGSPGRE